MSFKDQAGDSMLTHVELRSAAFPAYEDEHRHVGEGRYGKRLAEYLCSELAKHGEHLDEVRAEDWGWVIPVREPAFSLWIGVGNYEEHSDGFLCFIEPHQPYVRRFFKKLKTVERVSTLQSAIDEALKSHPEIHAIRWWSYSEFNSL